MVESHAAHGNGLTSRLNNLRDNSADEATEPQNIEEERRILREGALTSLLSLLPPPPPPPIFLSLSLFLSRAVRVHVCARVDLSIYALVVGVAWLRLCHLPSRARLSFCLGPRGLIHISVLFLVSPLQPSSPPKHWQHPRGAASPSLPTLPRISSTAPPITPHM